MIVISNKMIVISNKMIVISNKMIENYQKSEIQKKNSKK